jgi:hypothetical protein
MELTFGPSGKKKDTKRLTSVEMKCFRTEWCTFFDNRNNEEVLEELKVEPVNENLRRYKSNWLQGHETRMNNKMPKIMLKCRTNGRRRLGGLLRTL